MDIIHVSKHVGGSSIFYSTYIYFRNGNSTMDILECFQMKILLRYVNFHQAHCEMSLR